MNKFNIDSAKFLAIIIAICFIFIMVVWKAFDYIPKTDAENNQVQSETFVEEDVNKEQFEEEQEYEEQIEEEQVDKDQFKEERASDENYREEEARIRDEREAMLREVEEMHRIDLPKEKLEPLENIVEENAEPVQGEHREEISFTNLINTAQRSMIGQNYTASITEYQKALDLATSSEEKALCYEGMANVYAIQKRYGSALSAAQKSYNSYPNTAREVLLARLYYKTGDVNRANARMSNVLKRDFMSNDK